MHEVIYFDELTIRAEEIKAEAEDPVMKVVNKLVLSEWPKHPKDDSLELPSLFYCATVAMAT